MNHDWAQCTVFDLVQKGDAEIKTGPFGTQLHASDYVESGIPMINVRNIGFGNIREEKLEFISEETANRLSSHILKPKDIVFGRRAAVDRHAFIGDKGRIWFQGTDCIRLRIKSNSVDARFLSYSFLTSEHKQWMLNHTSHGATMAALNQEIVSRIPLLLPPLPTQRRITTILSAYDDLIENNTRRIQILEEMARRIYEEWFVRFRFPGHENVKMVESKRGEIPEGWKVKKLKDICGLVQYGYTASATREPTSSRFLRITDIVPFSIDWESVPYCEVSEKDFEKYKLNTGDIVIARTGATTGFAKRINKSYPATIFASYLVRIRADIGVSNILLGIAVESEDYKRFIKANLGGAAQPQANAQVLTSYTLAVPPTKLQQDFDKIVECLIDQKEVLQKKNLVLRRTRDLLLPKLISGEIDVSDLDIKTDGL